MAATPRNDIVKLRLTTLEKRDWVEAAGGSRRLSEWIRAVCNAEAAATRDPSTVTPDTPLATSGAYPFAAQEQAHRETRPLPASRKPRGVSSGRKAPVAVGVPSGPAPAAQSSDCPRWMHHRSGTYCGTCKTVIR